MGPQQYRALPQHPVRHLIHLHETLEPSQLAGEPDGDLCQAYGGGNK